MLTKTLKFLGAVSFLGAAMAFVSCSPSGPRTVDYPIINFANTSTLDITRVELNDSNTVLHVNAYYRPGYWIRIAEDTHLVADGKQYAMTGTDGIEPGTEFWMPESGEANFKLIFEPLPYSTKRFDFIEGNDPRAFTIWDIDITGKQAAKYPEGLPEELKKDPVDGQVPEPIFEMGNTTINIHMLPYRPEFGSRLNIYVNSMYATQDEHIVKIDDKGNGSISFDQYGSAHAAIVNPEQGYLLGSMTLYPGETLDCYIDMRTSGYFAMSHRPDSLKSSINLAINTGYYSNFDRMTSGIKDYYGLNLHTGEFADYHMSGDEYMAMVKSRYETNSQSIAESDAPQMIKEYHMLRLQNDVLDAISAYRYLLGHNYRNVKGDWRSPINEDSIPARLTDKDFAQVTTWFDTSNPRLLMLDVAIGSFNWNEHGAKGDLSKSILKFSEMAAIARNRELTQADIDSLKTLSNPFFAEACDSINQRAIRECLRLQELANVPPTPDTDDNIFDAIIAPHKGKVVVVDLWNTWCGPCRAALSANEPLKENELSSDDIVWIYIADDSSDHTKYLSMIPDIKGIHYKLTTDQKDAICKRFNVDGIPYYILVDRSGKAEGRPDIRDHSKYIEAIKSKL